MKPRRIVLAGGLIVSAWLALLADKAPADPVTEAVVRPDARSVGGARMSRQDGKRKVSGHGAKEKTIDVLEDRDVLIGGARSGSGAAQLFANQSWTPPPPPPPAPPLPPPPSAPPLPYKFLGKKLEDNVWEVFLARDDQTFIVREHSTMEGTYRVESIRPPTMTVTYLPLNQIQTLVIGGAEQ